MQNSRSIYTTKAQYNERRPNQERTGENRTGGRCKCAAAGVSPDRAAQSLQVLKDLSLCASQEAKKKNERTPRRREEPEACAARSFPVYRLALARAGRALQSNGGGVGKKEEEQEEDKKREVSSINGLPFCSPARQIAFFFYRVFLVIHFADAVILSRSFWGPGEAAPSLSINDKINHKKYK